MADFYEAYMLLCFAKLCVKYLEQQPEVQEGAAGKAWTLRGFLAAGYFYYVFTTFFTIFHYVFTTFYLWIQGHARLDPIDPIAFCFVL